MFTESEVVLITESEGVFTESEGVFTETNNNNIRETEI